MQTKELVKNALRYPLTSSKLFIVFILTLGDILIIPSILTGGYLIRIIESTLEGSKDLPEFTDIKKLLFDGIKYAVVSIIYGIPIFLVSALISGLNPLPFNPDLFAQENIFIIWIPYIISTIAVFLVDLIFFMGLVNMVHEKSIKSAFKFKKILQLIKKISWKKYLILIVIYTIITTSWNLIELVLYLVYPLTTTIEAYNIPLTVPILDSDTSLTFFIIFGIINSYLLVFTGRFLGLIYPNKENNE